MPNYNKKISETAIRIGEIRFSYAHVFSPVVKDDGAEKYSAMLIIPKKDKEAVKLIQDAIKAAQEAGKGQWGGKIPANCHSPLRDGDIDREDDETYAGCYFLNCSSKRKPGVRVLEDGQLTEAMGDEDFYSGCYGAASINFFPYSSAGNKGVGVGLNNVVKTRDGENLAGGRSADADFGDLASDNDILD